MQTKAVIVHLANACTNRNLVPSWEWYGMMMKYKRRSIDWNSWKIEECKITLVVIIDMRRSYKVRNVIYPDHRPILLKRTRKIDCLGLLKRKGRKNWISAQGKTRIRLSGTTSPNHLSDLRILITMLSPLFPSNSRKKAQTSKKKSWLQGNYPNLQ